MLLGWLGGWLQQLSLHNGASRSISSRSVTEGEQAKAAGVGAPQAAGRSGSLSSSECAALTLESWKGGRWVLSWRESVGAGCCAWRDNVRAMRARCADAGELERR